MKKTAIMLTAVMCLTGCLFSCTEDKKEEEQQPPKRVSTAPLDEELIGEWYNGTTGFIFGENRKMGMIYNFSDRGHFTAEGQMQTANELIPKENMTYDGKRIYVENTVYEDSIQSELTSVLIDMERLEGEDPDSLDGRYKIYGGIVVDVLSKELGIGAEYLSFEGVIDGEQLIIFIMNAFDYEIKDSRIEIFSDIVETDQNMAYNYKTDGDTLTMTYAAVVNAPEEVYTKFSANLS